MSEFKEFSKIPRLNRDIVITEKIDGTNAAVLVEEQPEDSVQPGILLESGTVVRAQSRSRFVSPEKDNYGFGRWVFDNAQALADLLGGGLHFGEWWGAGVQRKYNQTTKRFSLFNVTRYGQCESFLDPRCLPTYGNKDVINPTTVVTHKFHDGVKMCQCRDAQAGIDTVIGGVPLSTVPVLYRGPWFTEATVWAPGLALNHLQVNGSQAAPGFMDPEGIVIFHEASGHLYKVTIKGDDKPKSLA
jgi:hypothetical protein